MRTLTDSQQLPENSYRMTFDNLSKVAILPSLYRQESEVGVLEGRITALNGDTNEAEVTIMPSVVIYIPFDEMSYREQMKLEDLVRGRYLGKHVQFVIIDNVGGKLIGSRRRHQSETIQLLKKKITSGKQIKFCAALRQVQDSGAFIECTAGLTGRIPFLSAHLAQEDVLVDHPISSRINVVLTDIRFDSLTGKNLIILEEAGDTRSVKITSGRIISYLREENVSLIKIGLCRIAKLYNPPIQARAPGVVLSSLAIFNCQHSIAVIPPQTSYELRNLLQSLDILKSIKMRPLTSDLINSRVSRPERSLQALAFLYLLQVKVGTLGTFRGWLKRRGCSYSDFATYNCLLYLALQHHLLARETPDLDAVIKQLQLEQELRDIQEEINASLVFSIAPITCEVLNAYARSPKGSVKLEIPQLDRNLDTREGRQERGYFRDIFQSNMSILNSIRLEGPTRPITLAELSGSEIYRLVLEEAFAGFGNLTFQRITRFKISEKQSSVLYKVYSKCIAADEAGRTVDVKVVLTAEDARRLISDIKREREHTRMFLAVKSGYLLEDLANRLASEDSLLVF